MDISTIGAKAESPVSALGTKTLGKEDFLKLLLKQLSHQDPLNPMDSTEFTSQLSQFSSLEQLTNINTTLSNVLAFQQSMQNASVSHLIGKTVQVDGNSLHLNDEAEVPYELLGDASSVEITVYDSAGKPVWSTDLGPQGAGQQQYFWSGNDLLGNELPQGSYTFEIEAYDGSGKTVPSLTRGSGIVTEIVFEEGLTFLVLDGTTRVNLSEIKSIG